MSIIVYKQRFAPPKDYATPIKDYLHVGYIAMRPRTMKNEDGVHGLFGYLSPSQPVENIPWQETAKHIRLLSKRNVNIFRGIISFNRADAEDIGLITQKDWKEYAEQHIRILAEKKRYRHSKPRLVRSVSQRRRPPTFAYRVLGQSANDNKRFCFSENSKRNPYRAYQSYV